MFVVYLQENKICSVSARVVFILDSSWLGCGQLLPKTILHITYYILNTLHLLSFTMSLHFGLSINFSVTFHDVFCLTGRCMSAVSVVISFLVLHAHALYIVKESCMWVVPDLDWVYCVRSRHIHDLSNKDAIANYLPYISETLRS